MGWSGVVPSFRLLILIIIASTATVCVCVTSCVMLWLAPQVPFSSHNYNGRGYIHYPSLVLAATALVAALSLFPGSCGLSRDSKAALSVYGVMVVLVISGELAGSGTLLTFSLIGKVKYKIGQSLKHDVIDFQNNGTNCSSLTYRINSLQSNYECCGVDGYKDWGNDTKWRKREAAAGQLAPESCCSKPTIDDCSFNISLIYHSGCVNVLMDRTSIAVYCTLAGAVVSAALNLGTVILITRTIYYMRRYQNYTVI